MLNIKTSCARYTSFFHHARPSRQSGELAHRPLFLHYHRSNTGPRLSARAEAGAAGLPFSLMKGYGKPPKHSFYVRYAYPPGLQKAESRESPALSTVWATRCNSSLKVAYGVALTNTTLPGLHCLLTPPLPARPYGDPK